MTAVQDAQGRVVPASHLAIKIGDFVDVKVVASIRTYPTRGRRETSLQFAMKRVIQVCSARRMPQVRISRYAR